MYKKNKLLLISSIMQIVFCILWFVNSLITTLQHSDFRDWLSYFFVSSFTYSDWVGYFIIQVHVLLPFAFLLIGILGLIFNCKDRMKIFMVVIGIIGVILSLFLGWSLFIIFPGVIYNWGLAVIFIVITSVFLILNTLYLIGAIQNKRKKRDDKKSPL